MLAVLFAPYTDFIREDVSHTQDVYEQAKARNLNNAETFIRIHFSNAAKMKKTHNMLAVL